MATNNTNLPYSECNLGITFVTHTIKRKKIYFPNSHDAPSLLLSPPPPPVKVPLVEYAENIKNTIYKGFNILVNELFFVNPYYVMSIVSNHSMSVLKIPNIVCKYQYLGLYKFSRVQT